MPLLSNAQNIVLNSSHLTDITITNSPGPTGIDILFEASIPDAAYDSSARDPPPRCFPGTREQYIEDILNWALPAVGDTLMPIYWMKGPAGVGKSAVAQTCAEKLKRQRKLGAAFFFSINRHLNNISINNKAEHSKFFTSIAYQLSTIYPNYRNLLDSKIRQDRSLVNKTMESQFWGLIVEPLQELEEKGLGIGERIPIFVDGLDECKNREALCEIVEMVVAAARDGVVPLCWAFFSRPEPHIEATFSSSDISPLCHITTLPISHDADGDIELYLRAGLKHILRRLNITLTSPWPSDNDIQKLVRASGGLFIYAKTVLRFVGQPDSLNPEELLRAIIAVISNRDQCGIVTEFAELDAFYMLIMERIPTKLLPAIQRALAFLSWNGNSSAVMIANYLGLSRTELEAICGQLSSVIHFRCQPTPLDLDPEVDTSESFLHTNHCFAVDIRDTIYFALGGSISFHHKSFKDFLLNPLRSEMYCVNPVAGFFEVRERNLASQLENFYRWQNSKLVRAPGAPDSTSCLSYPSANELVNSFIEAAVYEIINAENTHFGADFDFRKRFYIGTSMPTSRDMFSITLFQCAGWGKYVHRTILRWIQSGEFPKFDIAGFKRRIIRQQQMNIIRPYHTTACSLLNEPKGRVESELYVMGHGSKSIFWYWEIDYDLETYRQFRTIDLAEGERAYREQFGSRPDSFTDISDI